MKEVLVRASGCVELLVDEVALAMIRSGRAVAYPPKKEEEAEVHAEVQAGNAAPKGETAVAPPVQETATQPSYVRSSKTALRKLMATR